MTPGNLRSLWTWASLGPSVVAIPFMLYFIIKSANYELLIYFGVLFVAVGLFLRWMIRDAEEFLD